MITAIIVLVIVWSIPAYAIQIAWFFWELNEAGWFLNSLDSKRNAYLKSRILGRSLLLAPIVLPMIATLAIRSSMRRLTEELRQ